MSRVLFSLLVLMAVSVSQAQLKVSQNPKLVFMPSVPAEQADQLISDLVKMDKMKFKDTSGETQRLLKVANLDVATLKGWLGERAKIIIGESQKMDAIYVLQSDAVYPEADLLPEAVLEARGQMKALFHEEKKAHVVMSNVGAGLYLAGKVYRQILGFDIGEGIILPIRSPRVGLFQIGPGLFYDQSGEKQKWKINDRALSLYRLAVLFHESRHSDGRGRSGMFAHATCPQDHDFAGLPACDKPSNGPYRVGGLIFQSARLGCADCSPAEKEMWALNQLDSENRLMTPFKSVTFSNESLCGALLKKGLKPAFCQPQITTPIEWDDAFETF